MAQRGPKTTQLPRYLLESLGIEVPSRKQSRKGFRPEARKEHRKATGEQKKTLNAPHVKTSRYQSIEFARSNGISPRDQLSSGTEKSAPPKSILKKTRSDNAAIQEFGTGIANNQSYSPPPQISKGLKDRLAQDDAEIAALEKALGVKNAKKLPRSFGDDGLDVLLEGLEPDPANDHLIGSKRKRSEENDWLRTKRQKAAETATHGMEDEGNRNHNVDLKSSAIDDEIASNDTGPTKSSDLDSSIVDEARDASSLEPQQRIRENPYIAPVTDARLLKQSKYVSPSKRGLEVATTGDGILKLRRQIQGLLNRLSEVKLLSITKEFEGVYRTYPRQDVTITLIGLLMGLLCDPTTLQDTFVILHAGFIAAMHKVIGPEISAQMIMSIYDEITKLYDIDTKEDSARKQLSNLINLIAQLYNFRVVASALVYDLIRLFLEELSEKNTELLVKIVRNSGPQLRKDDTASLKAINELLQSAVAKMGLQNVSIRTGFMVDTIDSLANKGMKTGKAESLINSEHTSRMRNLLGTLNERSTNVSEPLNVTLKDLRESDRRGKWWIVGATYRDDAQDRQMSKDSRELLPPSPHASRTHPTSSEGLDLTQLAHQLGLNTDVRRSIFVTLLSGDDFNTACDRLRKLPLNAKQRFEIPSVLIRCSGAEREYNPYYTLTARRLISRDPKLKKVFQYSLRNLFHKLSEHNTDDEESGDEVDGKQIQLRTLVNHGTMFGTLIVQDGIPISVLRDLNFAYLPEKLQYLVEVLLITVILISQEGIEKARSEQRLMDVFLGIKAAPNTAQELRYFLKSVVSKTDIAGSREKQATVKWGCKVARDALKAVSITEITE